MCRYTQFLAPHQWSLRSIAAYLGPSLSLAVSYASLAVGLSNKKKIDKSIDFLRGWEKKMVSIFCLRSREKMS